MEMVRLAVLSCCFLLHFAVATPPQAPLVDKPVALNPQLTNIIESDSITLYYNGTGPVPRDDEISPRPEPISPMHDPRLLEDHYFRDISAILNATNTPFGEPCSKCMAATAIMHTFAISQPVPRFTSLIIRICEAFPNFRDNNPYATDCSADFHRPGGLGAYYAQLYSQMSIATNDIHAWCAFQERVCEHPPVVSIDESLYFSSKPPEAEIAPEPSGKTFDVLHLSDWHLDPRYDIASEGNCTVGDICCRSYSANADLFTTSQNASVPASRFGNFKCDTPADLALSAFSEMKNFFKIEDLAFTIFTGDIVSHDQDNRLSQDYITYEEEVSYKAFKKMLGDVPLYLTLGNHDSMPRAFNIPHSLNPDPSNTSTNAMAWNYDLVSSLWQKYSWISKSEARFAATHYGAYATTTAQGLRIISFNADFWFRGNIFNYFNSTNPDSSGMLKWIADELTACEKKGQRAWLMAHVLSGYDGSQALPQPTALFHTIVRRFSPRTIAAIFFGHTHQDQIQIFYDFLDNSTNPLYPQLRDPLQIDFTKPLQTAFIGPSITPLLGLNSGYRVYSIDAKTFSVIESKTYIANMSNSLDWDRPIWEFEYDAREAYSYSPDHKQDVSVNTNSSAEGDATSKKHKSTIPWPATSPLNATFFHLLTEKMLSQSQSHFSHSSTNHKSLIEKYNTYETKSSIAEIHRGVPVSAEEKVCYIRSGSAEMGSRCRTKFETEEKTDEQKTKRRKEREKVKQCGETSMGLLGDSWKVL